MANEAVIKPNLFLRLLEEAEGVRRVRAFTGAWQVIFKVVAASYSVLLIYSVTANQWTSSDLRGLFVLFVACMIFMRYPANARSPMHRPSAVDFPTTSPVRFAHPAHSKIEILPELAALPTRHGE